jgi:hypothetical protein
MTFGPLDVGVIFAVVDPLEVVTVVVVLGVPGGGEVVTPAGRSAAATKIAAVAATIPTTQGEPQNQLEIFMMLLPGEEVDRLRAAADNIAAANAA